jgi:long-chain acyl-CoA synthetase
MSDSFQELWLSHLRERPDELFVTTEMLRWTYDEFGAAVERTVEAIDPFDTICLALPNGADFVRFFFAALVAGKTVCPLNPRFGAAECDQILRLARPDVVLVPELDEEHATAWHHINPSKYPTERLTTRELLAHKRRGRGKEYFTYDGGVVLYTSGTTGAPKGVKLSLSHLLAEARVFSAFMDLDSNDFKLTFLPLFHVFGLALGLFMPWYLGSSVAILNKFSVTPFWEAIDRHPVTYFTTVPTALNAILAQHIPTINRQNLRFAISGAAPLSEETLTAWEREVCPVHEGYGLTETTAAVTVNPVHGSKKVHSVGLPLPDVEIRIISDQIPARPLPENTRGEIVIRGPMVVEEYCFTPEEEARYFWYAEDGSKWLRTGDVGTLDDDGYLFIVDRKKDVINRGGEKIYPKEVERLISQYPGVAEAVVVGVADRFYGEVPIAFVKPVHASFDDEAGLEKYLREQITTYKVPARFIVVEKLPRNASGKILRGTLRKHANQHFSSTE